MTMICFKVVFCLILIRSASTDFRYLTKYKTRIKYRKSLVIKVKERIKLVYGRKDSVALCLNSVYSNMYSCVFNAKVGSR